MKVFISWSGEPSKQLAEVLRQWLPGVLQAVKPYYSPDDVAKGTRWATEISKELEESSVGLICLTQDNLEAPWVMFEAGALSKKMDRSKVCPLLFGVDPSDIKGPLVQFQCAHFGLDEMKRVVKMMNSEMGGAALEAEVLEGVFDMWWPRLDGAVTSALAGVASGGRRRQRPVQDMLDELLALTRQLATSAVDASRQGGDGPADVKRLRNIVRAYVDSVAAANLLRQDAAVGTNRLVVALRELHEAIRGVMQPVEAASPLTAARFNAALEMLRRIESESTSVSRPRARVQEPVPDEPEESGGHIE